MSHTVSFPSWETHPSIIFSHLAFTFSSAAQDCNPQGPQGTQSYFMSKPSTNQQTNERYLQLLQGSLLPVVRFARPYSPNGITDALGLKYYAIRQK